MISASLKAEVENTFQIAPDRCTAEELVFICPEPSCGDTSGNRSLNLRTGLTSCWRCGKGRYNKGNFLAWARANGYRFTNSQDAVGIPLEEVLVEPKPLKSRVPYVTAVSLPTGFTYLREEPASGYARLIGMMAKRKRLTLEDFIEAEAGFTRDDDYWEPFCIFPVKELNETVYYQGRTYRDVEGQTTKQFPSRRVVPHGASCWLYNYDEFYQRKAPIVLVVESILNVLSLRKKLRQLNVRDVVPICVFKHSISAIQATKLFQCKWLKEICMLFDADAVDTTWNHVARIGNNAKLTIAEMPATPDNKRLDPNDDVEAAWRAFETRQSCTAGTAMARLWLDAPVGRNLAGTYHAKCLQYKA